MTPDERLNEAIAAFQRLEAPPRPNLTPPAGAVPAGPHRKHSHGRLLMKLSLGGLAAALVLGLALFTATPQVTMAQAVKEVQKHKLVRYQITIGKPVNSDDNELDTEYTQTLYEDLLERRFRLESISPSVDGYVLRRLTVWSHKSLTTLSAESTLPRPDNRHAKGAEVQIEVKVAKTLDELTQKGQFSGLFWTVNGLSENKASQTTRATLRGKPVVKIVNRVSDKVSTTVWLDPGTKLPIQIERKGVYSGSRVCIESDFEWDPVLPAGVTADALFSTDVRNGYWVLAGIKR